VRGAFRAAVRHRAATESSYPARLSKGRIGMNSLLEYVQVLGWAAAAFSVASAFVRTMIPLRIMSVWSNFTKITYAASVGSLPGLVEYAIILPLNIYRLRQMRKLIRDIHAAPAGGLHHEWLAPFASSRDVPAGEILFRKGDVGDRLYYLSSGTIVFDEIEVEIGAGTLFGEIAFFSRNGLRTQTARCLSDCRLLSIGEHELKQLYFQNPEFGWYLVQLIAQRLTDNAARAERRDIPT
jgi:hypothetical protein